MQSTYLEAEPFKKPIRWTLFCMELLYNVHAFFSTEDFASEGNLQGKPRWGVQGGCE